MYPSCLLSFEIKKFNIINKIKPSKINGIVSWICYNLFGTEPQYLAATSARKSCGIKVPKGQKAKDVALQFVVAHVEVLQVSEVEALGYRKRKLAI